VTQQPKGPGPDPVGDLQRWLLRTGARGVSRGVQDQIRGLLGGGGGAGGGDVWEAATAPPPQEAPECAWCPICRAARLLRSRPDLASNLASAGDTLAAVVAGAATAVESALAAAQRAAAENAQPAAGRPAPGPAGEPGPEAEPPSPQEPPHEPDDRG
jgi:hypothetical protein